MFLPEGLESNVRSAYHETNKAFIPPLPRKLNSRKSYTSQQEILTSGTRKNVGGMRLPTRSKSDLLAVWFRFVSLNFPHYENLLPISPQRDHFFELQFLSALFNQIVPDRNTTVMNTLDFEYFLTDIWWVYLSPIQSIVLKAATSVTLALIFATSLKLFTKRRICWWLTVRIWSIKITLIIPYAPTNSWQYDCNVVGLLASLRSGLQKVRWFSAG